MTGWQSTTLNIEHLTSNAEGLYFDVGRSVFDVRRSLNYNPVGGPSGANATAFDSPAILPKKFTALHIRCFPNPLGILLHSIRGFLESVGKSFAPLVSIRGFRSFSGFLLVVVGSPLKVIRGQTL